MYTWMYSIYLVFNICVFSIHIGWIYIVCNLLFNIWYILDYHMFFMWPEIHLWEGCESSSRPRWLENFEAGCMPTGYNSEATQIWNGGCMILIFLLSSVLVLRIVVFSSIRLELLKIISLGFRCITDRSTNWSNICVLRVCSEHAPHCAVGIMPVAWALLLCWFSILDN